MLGLGLAIPTTVVRGLDAAGLHPATAALLGRMTTQPGAQRATVIDTLIRSLVDAGVWSLLDFLYVMGAHDAQAAGLNWTGAAALTPVNAPVFTADRGYQGDGTASFLSTDHNPAAAPGSFRMGQNDMHAGALTLSAPSLSNGFDLGAANNLLGVRARGSGGTAAIAIGGGVTMIAGTAFPQHVVGVRRDAANQLVFQGGVQSTSGAVASSGLPSAITVLRRDTLYGNRQVMAVHAGAALSDAQVAACTNALVAYGRSVGAIPA